VQVHFWFVAINFEPNEKLLPAFIISIIQEQDNLPMTLSIIEANTEH
jgi:hypothetical protein